MMGLFLSLEQLLMLLDSLEGTLEISGDIFADK